MSRVIVYFLVLVMALGLSLPLTAQDNPRRELNKLMKTMPEELQAEILNYAQRKKQAYESAQARAETKAVEAETVAKQKAKVATAPAMQVEPKPASTLSSSFSAPKPNRPAWQERAEELPQTNVEWEEERHQFGEVESGELVKHTFKFKNTGEHSLELTRVKASCGCTVPSYSKEPIQPGEEGSIDVTFNTRGKRGRQVKTVTVSGNFPKNMKVLRIEGEVMMRDEN